MSVQVTVPWCDVRHAALVGVARHAVAYTQKRHQPIPSGNKFYPGICGALGELAVAKALGVYWEPNIGGTDSDTGDVAGYQVRANMPSTEDRLLVRPSDPPADCMILVTGCAPCFTIEGWIYVKDAPELATKRYEDSGAFYVPASKLHPWAERPQ